MAGVQPMQPVPRSRHLVFWLVAIGGCSVDLLTKHWIFQRLGMPMEHPTEWLWEPVFGFTTSLNEGALFGIGQGRGTMFACLSMLAAVGIVYWLFWLGAATDLLLTIALACVAGGIAGNLYDRLGLPGLVWHDLQATVNRPAGSAVYAVRDWLDFQYIHFAIFNIADSLLVCGAGLLICHAFLEPSKAAKTSAVKTAEIPAKAVSTSPS